MRIELTSTPANIADQTAAYMVIDRIVVEDCAISGDLYDADDNIVAHGRVYAYTGPDKNIPFDDLTDAQIDHLTGAVINPEWIYPVPVEDADLGM